MAQKILTAHGNAQLSTAQKEFGTASGIFNGTNNTRVSTPDDTDWDATADDYTVDFWVMPATNPTGGTHPAQLIGQIQVDADGNWFIYLYSDRTLAVGKTGVSELQTGTFKLTADVWQHVAVTRTQSTGTTKIYVGGVEKASGTGSYWNNATGVLNIGGEPDSTDNSYIGYIDEIRVSKGIVRWTSGFTPPTSAYTTDSYTKLLMHCDGTNGSTTFIDDSVAAATNKTFTSDGIVKTKNIDKTFTTDGKMKASSDKTLTSDGRVKIVPSELWDNDGIIFGTNDKGFTTDGIVKEVQVKTITSDILLSTNKAFTSDGIVKATADKGFATDGIVKIVIDKGFTNDGIVKAFSDKGFGTDGIILVVVDKGFTSDGIILVISDKEFTTDGIVLIVVEKTFDTDGIIKVLDNDKQFTTDGIVVMVFDKQFTNDGIILTINEKSFTSDGLILVATDKEFTTDGRVLQIGDKLFSSDGIIVVPFVDFSFTTDGIIFVVGGKTFTTDGIVAVLTDKNFTTDGIIVQPVGPYITFRDDSNPSVELTSITYPQTKDGVVLPVLQGELSDIIRFRIYNNWSLVVGAVAVFNCKLTTYDDEIHLTENTPPVSGKWIRVQELGYGEGTAQPGNLTNYAGTDIPVGGGSQVLIPERGSNGSGSPIIRASSSLLGFLRFQTYAELPPAVAAANYAVALVFEYEFVI